MTEKKYVDCFFYGFYATRLQLSAYKITKRIRHDGVTAADAHIEDTHSPSIHRSSTTHNGLNNLQDQNAQSASACTCSAIRKGLSIVAVVVSLSACVRKVKRMFTRCFDHNWMPTVFLK